ncbi:MAG: hypothetical protein CMM08_15690 [Rhodospirillaceae bacterium]|nr:hypothetical protein [Rhodospirillaceae bacterium]
MARISGRPIFLILGLLILLSVTYAMVFVANDYRDVSAKFDSELALAALEVRNVTDDYFRRHEEIFKVISESECVLAKRTETCNQFFSRLIHRFPSVTNFSAVNADGDFFASGKSFDEKSQSSVKELPFFRELAAGKPRYVMNPHIGSIGGVKVTGMASPLRSSLGEFAGMIGISMKLEEIESLWRGVFDQQRHQLVILDRGGIVIAATPSFEHMVGKEASSAGNLDRIMKSQAEKLLQIDAEEYRFRLAVSETSAWRIVALGPYRLPYLEYLQTSPWVAGLSLPFAIVVLASIVLMLRERRYVERLVQSETEVRRYSTGLEQAVTERTRELSVEIEERKRAETALQESEARYRNIISTTSEGFWLIGADNLTIYANDALCQMLEYSRQEMLGRSPLAFVDEENKGIFRTQFAKRPITSQRTFEIELQAKSGKTLSTNFNSTNLTDSSGKVSGAFAFVSDISDRKRAEEHLRQAQKMEAVGQLTGGVAHDFNNLLAIIMGHADLLSRLEGVQGMQEKRTIEFILKASRRGAELTQRLLAFSRKQFLDPKVLDLGDMLPEMIEMLGRTLGETIEIRLAAADDLWSCEADPGQLENAVLNLAINARDAMPEGGRLTIETANVELDDHGAGQRELEPGPYVMLAVSDSGSGIAAVQLKRVFEPFFTTKEVGRGSGLGLSMVYGFARQSGGHATIYSEVGQGTTVRLYLPRSDAALAPEAAGPRVTKTETYEETVLVVEDDDDVRDLTVALLEALGYSVLAAGDGRAALDILEGNRGVDLLLTDVILPGGMLGPELAERAADQGIKVLYMSGYAENAIHHQGRLDKDVTLLPKPFDMASLSQKLREVLE